MYYNIYNFLFLLLFLNKILPNNDKIENVILLIKFFKTINY